MSEETFPYDQWVNEALRSVLSRALIQLSERGPVGDHHFFINFDTSHEGVDIPGFLRAQYPEEITIVLQHQFEELIIDEQGFEVSLSFSGKKSRLKVPFDAVTSFADPSVNFGLQIGINAVNEAIVQGQLDTEGDEDDLAQSEESAGDNSPTPFVPAQPQKADEAFKDEGDYSDEDVTENAGENTGENTSENTSEKAEDDAEDDGPQTAEVITLDAFRKK